MHLKGKKKVIISVVSDLVTDQRVNRAAITLHNAGYDVVLVGRELNASLELETRPYKTRRFKLWFEKGPLFYLNYNLRLLFYLLFNRADIYLSNDLDTLAANYIASRIKKTEIIYDSHEYFTEVPELINHPFKRSIWMKIENWIFPKLKNVYTVNESIANIYREKYKIDVKVIRNLPFSNNSDLGNVTRQQYKIPDSAIAFLFQGAGINIDRGAEEAMDAIAEVNNAVLIFIGGGDVIEKLKSVVVNKNLSTKVFFIPKKPMNMLRKYTQLADFGLSLDKATNLNYRYSLPNKLFDYIQAGLPVLATDLVEVRKVIENYQIGMITSSSEPTVLASTMRVMMEDKDRLAQWKKNLTFAASELCWENEQQKLLEIFSNVSAG
jgi:glycosyltransferase involved in cell wall biosynthesis